MAVGDCWVLGQHQFHCRSALDPRSSRTLRADLFYSDPPWNQGNLNSFHTKAGLDKAGFSYLALYERIVELANGRPCFIEGGAGQVDAVRQVIEAAGNWAVWPITYYRRSPCVLHYVGPPLPAHFDPAGLDDDDTPGYVMRALNRYVTICDPCAGMGLTSRCAQAAGWASVSSELNPHRVSVALSRMAEIIGTEPKPSRDP